MSHQSSKVAQTSNPPIKSVNKSMNQSPTESKVVAIQRTDVSTFDDAFSFLREKFAAEMKRIEDEMDKLNTQLVKMYHQKLPSLEHQHQNQPVAMTSQNEQSAWKTVTASPLVQDNGDDKMLTLQFDVSQFNPSEVRVIIDEDTLTVTAHYEEKTEHSHVLRSFRRDFLLPKEINPDSVISSLSRDGVLTVQAPFPMVDLSLPRPAGNKALGNQTATSAN